MIEVHEVRCFSLREKWHEVTWPSLYFLYAAAGAADDDDYDLRNQKNRLKY
jgi:hypothetical protein